MDIPQIKEITGFPGYFISDIGEVYSTKVRSNSKYIKGIMHEMALKEDKNGYFNLGLRTIDGKRYFKRVNRLVAQEFIPNPNNYPIINHKDGNVKNNTVENLEWCTYSENLIHSFKVLGRKPSITTARKVKLINLQTNEVLVFNSIKDCSNYLNMSYDYLVRLLSGKCNINNWRNNDIYSIEYLDNEGVTTSRKTY